MFLVDLSESFDPKVVRSFYEQIMVPMFPLDEERDTLEYFLGGINPAGPGIGDEEVLHVVCAFADPLELGDSAVEWVPHTEVPKNCQLAGAVCFEYYMTPNITLLTYIAALPSFRGRGIGRKLVDAVEEYSCEDAMEYNSIAQCRAIFAETHGHGLVDDVMDCTARQKVLKSYGFEHIVFPYVQPPLAKGGKSAEDLILLVKILSEHEVTKSSDEKRRMLNGQLVYQFLEAFWPYEEYEDVKSREYYQAAVDYLSTMDTLELSSCVPWNQVPFNQLPTSVDAAVVESVNVNAMQPAVITTSA